jgi:hypothetical protein
VYYFTDKSAAPTINIDLKTIVVFIRQRWLLHIQVGVETLMFFDEFLQRVLERNGLFSAFLGYLAMPLQATAGQCPYLAVERLVERFRVLLVGLEGVKVAPVDADVGLGYCGPLVHVLGQLMGIRDAF